MLLGFLLGGIIGIVGMALLCSYKVNRLEADRNNAEVRALTHFRKLMAIEDTLRGIKETADSKEKDRLLKKIKEIIERRI